MTQPVRAVRTATGPVDAVVEVPGSKSIANRALVCAALASGESHLRRVPDGDDTAAMVECLSALGVLIDDGDGDLRVSGTGGVLVPTVEHLHARLAGTSSRFVTALVALGDRPVTVDGAPALRRRPMEPLHDALRQLGVHVRPLDAHAALPVEIRGPATGRAVSLRGDVSSQFITALMLIGPCLPEGLEITVTSALVSRPYVELTAAVMAAFGAEEVQVGAERISVAPSGYRACEYTIEADASSASYPLAVAAVAGGTVSVPGVGLVTRQGDRRFADLLGAMGCSVRWEDHRVTVTRGAEPLRGLRVDMSDISDLVPTLAVVATVADTPTVIEGVGFIRHKESDRLADLAVELQRAGAEVSVLDDGLALEPARGALHGARLGTHHDHRLAMAFGVLGTAVAGIEVEDPSVVSKSWPRFWEMLETLAAGSR